MSIGTEAGFLAIIKKSGFFFKYHFPIFGIVKAAYEKSVSLCTGVENISSDGSILVFPNPFNSKITIVVSSTAQIQNFNAIGSLVYSDEVEEGKSEIDLTEISNGIYFIKIGTLIKKIIKE